ncbi:vacuolar sorting-associated 8 like [Fusarium subglutinans]|uniref:Vacuolar sorting-associated 8 like n=1 Tax=Gibberella subglutinans TaxID=42677 RepID=A0A8H5QAD2_GIBSU|nr:vacuolar sorting-associated 8 like [Fusarium subglutinans]KAF5610326.1 vacuolar sorting-associated 8 like [Fusarium subglutinans]
MADSEDLSLAGDVGLDNGDTINDAPMIADDDVDAGADAGDAGNDGLLEDGDEPDRHLTPVPIGNGSVTNRYREIMQQQHQDSSDVSSLGGSSLHGLPKRAGSPIDSVLSGPDDTPSIQGSFVSSPGSSVLPSVASRPGLSSPSPSFRPFDRRFQSRISSSAINTPRSSSPAFPFLSSHSRNVSLSSQFLLDQADLETPTPPWEVVRWTKLRKLNGHAFSEAGKRNFGSPTCLAVSATIVLGTSKGIILVFDYNQNLKMIIGPGTKAVESGPITAIAISADHTTIAGGHASGNIFTWDTGRASRPFLTIPHLEPSQLQNRTVDGHVPDVAITHLGFLGTRHTALVSADNKGMAFSHLATRGTGALGRTVKTHRILGRYPDAPMPPGKTVKPSTVLAFAPLPLGNVECSTDTLGLTAMLTPYLLVIVSTTPVAQTQHKSARPKDVPPHSAMTGCLAWFPAVKLKVPDPQTGSDISKVKLAYCWSNILTVLDVDEYPREDKDQPASYRFKARSRWKCEEAIVAVQWLSRSVLAVLTISQRMIVLEDRSMRMTEGFDLVQKYIYHADLFSEQLHTLVEQLDENDASMHGVVADAFYMSFKAYKGRIFILGFNEVSIGALSNWADRLIAMMENGDYLGAIQLATSYYTGDADKLTVGLPEDPSLRHTMVRDKIMEIISASLKYAFGQRQKDPDSYDDEHMKQLAETCFTACQAVDNQDFLFEDMYDWYEDADTGGIFLECLEPYILEKTITMVPPAVVKDLVQHYVSRGWESRLEEMICHMETATLDLDQITLLCKQHSLYDALIYVWNQALGDYITPMIDLLSLLIPLMVDGDFTANNPADDFFSINAFKIFPYLSYTLTGRVYPNDEAMSEEMATKAKCETYWFFFSGRTITWPKGSGNEFRTIPNSESQPSFPYLRMILKLDAPSFLSALNEAFEDPFLNDSTDQHMNGSRGDMPEEQIFGQTINRQYVLSILLDVMNPNDFAPEDTIYLDMFIARNLPKFPQYLLFSGTTLSRVLTGLCYYPGLDLAEDAQLSAEYLLSVYHPSDMPDLMPLFKNAGFYRILKRIYKTDKQYGNLVQTYFEDPEDQELIFDCLRECLRPHSGLTGRQIQEVLTVVEEHARRLLELDAALTAKTLAEQGQELHQHMIDSAEDAPDLQHTYLKTLLEPEEPTADHKLAAARDLVERYVQLMCKFEPSHVSDYVGLVQSTDLRLGKLLPTMEETGVIDAAVVLMAREGQVKDAMERLVKHLKTLESAMHGLLTGAEEQHSGPSLGYAAEDLLEALQKYVHVGIWLCQGQTKSSTKKSKLVQKTPKSANEALSPDEALWLSLIDACVQITKKLSPALSAAAEQNISDDEFDEEKLVALLRSLVQHTFTALLTTTSSQTTSPPGSKLVSNAGSNLSFLRILRAFLTQAAASSPNLADLRGVLASIFSAYAYEESILKLSNRLLERSLFVNVNQSVELRQRGWRPRGSTCEACSRRVWGPGVAGTAVFEAWEDKQAAEEKRRKERQANAAERAKGDDGETELKAKGKGVDTRPSSMLIETNANSGVGSNKNKPMGPLVVLACRHIYHQSCLDELQERQQNGVIGVVEREYRCPIDGNRQITINMSLSSDDEDNILSDAQSASSSGEDEDSPPRQLSQNLFAPPFYGRPPTPLPPSPSLTSLLRPSRPTTPDASDDDAIAPVPRAAPKVPTYEYYGFVLYLFSSLTFLIYLLWGYLPSPFLHALGIYYYPNRWWALAIPAFIVMTVVYIYVALAAFNTEMLTVPLSSVETVVDGAGKLAEIDAKGRLRGSRNRERKVHGDGRLRWREIWSEGTDAVMDIPLAGVCEILYGEGRDDGEDAYIDDEM